LDFLNGFPGNAFFGGEGLRMRSTFQVRITCGWRGLSINIILANARLISPATFLDCKRYQRQFLRGGSGFAYCENISLNASFAYCENMKDASDIPPALEAVLEKIS
jgi:hypothetical protein